MDRSAEIRLLSAPGAKGTDQRSSGRHTRWAKARQRNWSCSSWRWSGCCLRSSLGCAALIGAAEGSGLRLPRSDLGGLHQSVPGLRWPIRCPSAPGFHVLRWYL